VALIDAKQIAAELINRVDAKVRDEMDRLRNENEQLKTVLKQTRQRLAFGDGAARVFIVPPKGRKCSQKGGKCPDPVHIMLQIDGKRINLCREHAKVIGYWLVEK
jgi:hypothetical protein